MKKQTVYVVLYSHRFGTDCWVYKNKKKALKDIKEIEESEEFKELEESMFPEYIEFLEKEVVQ